MITLSDGRLARLLRLDRLQRGLDAGAGRLEECPGGPGAGLGCDRNLRQAEPDLHVMSVWSVSVSSPPTMRTVLTKSIARWSPMKSSSCARFDVRMALVLIVSSRGVTLKPT